MRKIDVQLNDLFDVVGEEIVEEEISEPEVIESNAENREVDINADYEKSREHYYKLLEKGNDALEYSLEIAKQTDHPRAFEVFGQLLKNTTEVNDRLLELQMKMEQMKALEKKGNPTKVTNALFVGSTAELQKLIKNKKKEDEHGED
tara:strand:- start:416 stop:856 length:441 start_codon:yes stop_codon:yes gene_type:complete